MTAAVELALLEWEEGARRMRDLTLTARRRGVLQMLVSELDAEIVRRVGQSFDLARLAAVYASSAPWCRDVAERLTPEPWAYDLSVVQPAAFARVARDAVDFRGA